MNSNLMKMVELSPNGYKTLWGKGEIAEIAHYEQFLFFP